MPISHAVILQPRHLHILLVPGTFLQIFEASEVIQKMQFQLTCDADLCLKNASC